MYFLNYLQGTLTIPYSVGSQTYRLRVVYNRTTNQLTDADISCNSGWRILTGTEFNTARAFVETLELESNYLQLGLNKSLTKPDWTAED